MRFAGALILNKIIDDLKSKLPFLKKKEEEIDAQSEDKTGLTEITDLNSVEDDSLEESESEDKSLLNKLKAKISSLQKKKKKPSSEEEDEDSEDDDEDSEENEEEEKKKKRSKIIRIAIVGALVVFLVSDYIFPPEDAPTEGTPEVVESPARRNKKKVEEAPTEAPAEEPTTPEETATPSEVTQTEPTDSTPVESTIPEPVETTPSEETPSGVEQLPDVSGEGSTESPTTTYTPDDSPVDITSDDNSIDTAPSESSSNDSIFGEDSSLGDLSTSDTDGGTGAGADDFTDQILQDLEKQANPVEEKKTVTKYIAPPDYEFQGRGLVYNCRGKHWACVDAPSYKTCEDNSISTKQFGKPTECYPFNVYETTRGCEITQNRMVSSNAKTKFCEE